MEDGMFNVLSVDRNHLTASDQNGLWAGRFPHNYIQYDDGFLDGYLIYCREVSEENRRAIREEGFSEVLIAALDKAVRLGYPALFIGKNGGQHDDLNLASVYSVKEELTD